MKIRIWLFTTPSIIVLCLLISCASTKVTGEWKDPNLEAKKFNNIMIIGIAKQPTQRMAYEDEFVRQLKAAGVMAISSHSIIPFDKMLDKETIVQNIDGMGIDGVIITRVRDVEDKIEYHRSNNMYDYYNRSFTVTPSFQTSSPIYKRKYNFESNLYDTKTEKLVFSLSSKTYAPENINKRLRPYIETVVKKLNQNKLL